MCVKGCVRGCVRSLLVTVVERVNKRMFEGTSLRSHVMRGNAVWCMMHADDEGDTYP